MAPVSRTLVATWREEGSSVVAKMEGGSSIGPSSSSKEALASESSENWGKQEHWRVLSGETEWKEMGL